MEAGRSSEEAEHIWRRNPTKGHKRVKAAKAFKARHLSQILKTVVKFVNVMLLETFYDILISVVFYVQIYEEEPILAPFKFTASHLSELRK
jgi:hypothetical protein